MADLTLWRHQNMIVSAPQVHPECNYFFDVSGYGAGKSFAIVVVMLWLVINYLRFEIVIGIGGDTIARLRKTVLLDFMILAKQHGIEYTFNAQQNLLKVGSISFILINMEQPEDIYAYTLSAFLGDELDELKQPDALEAFKASIERTRKPFPDGRAPFRMFFTTAQGYKGTYQIVTELEDKKTPFVLVRGLTKENLANSPSYYTDLYNVYNESERMAYLEGRFVNLTTGRVYYGYDEAKCKLPALPFVVEPNDPVMIGQDLNSGYSRGTAIVKRDKKLYVVRTFDFSQIGHAAPMIRTAFPSNNIEWFPDASGYEIVLGYAKEIQAERIECRVGTINPSIVDRIFFVNKLFESGRLFLGPGTEKLAMALKVRQYDDAGKPAKREGPNDPSHGCDSLEYVIWRIVARDPDFNDLWVAGREGRRNITDRVVSVA